MWSRGGGGFLIVIGGLCVCFGVVGGMGGERGTFVPGHAYYRTPHHVRYVGS